MRSPSNRAFRTPLVPFFIVFMQIEAIADEACDVYLDFINDERRVPGPVNEECGWTRTTSTTGTETGV